MSARTLAPANRDWWVPHVLIAVFGVLVAAMLAVVPGWSAPLHAWIALAALVIAVLAVDAVVRALVSAWRRRWRATLAGAALATGLGLTVSALLMFGHRHQPAAGDPFADAPAAVDHATR